MAATAVVRARIDEKTKRKATKVIEEMGLSVSDVIRLLLARVIEEQGMPFAVKVPKRKVARKKKPQGVPRSP